MPEDYKCESEAVPSRRTLIGSVLFFPSHSPASSMSRPAIKESTIC
jgi:hypothetical protein